MVGIFTEFGLSAPESTAKFRPLPVNTLTGPSFSVGTASDLIYGSSFPAKYCCKNPLKVSTLEINDNREN